MKRFLFLTTLAVAFAASSVSAWGAASCPLDPASPSVTLCTPTDGASGLTSPVHVNAGTTDSRPVNLIQIYLDGAKKYEIAQNWLDTDVVMADGTHRLTVQARDSIGVIFKKT